MAIPIIDTMRVHDAVYWGPKVDDLGKQIRDRYGNPIYEAPVHLNPADGTGVYWMDVVEILEGPGGEKKISKSRIFLGTDVREQGILFRGTLGDVPPALSDSPRSIPGIGEILRISKISTLENDQYLRQVWL